MSVHPPYPEAFVRAVCDVLAQTDSPGLTGSEIDRILAGRGHKAREIGYNKRDGLFQVLYNAQVPDQTGKPVIGFIHSAMDPIRYAKNPARFEALRGQLNEAMIFQSLALSDAGKVTRVKQGASTLPEAAQLAGRLHTELRRRGAHALLFKYCEEELISQSLFHGLSEASKSIPGRIRQLTGLAGDGAALYDQVFGTNRERPFLFINELATDSELGEHRGFKNLLLGIHGHYRNPRAHMNRVDRAEELDDFYDAMSLFSYVHRRLDSSSRDPLTNNV